MTLPIQINSKLPNLATTIFSVMSKLAAEHDAINLSQGFPDFDCDAELFALVSRYMQKGDNQYAAMPGVMRLREQLAEKIEDSYGTRYDPDLEITITAGATQGIYTAITAIINPGDEVIVFDPAYDSYEPAITVNGGITVHLELRPADYSIDWKQVEKSITHRTRMIIINTPHNPTGAVLSASDMLMLSQITKDTDIFIISDEVYEHIIFDGLSHYSVAPYRSLAERSFIISSFGKTFHATGWKIGYCLAPKALMHEFRKVHQYLVFSVNTPIQLALADYLQEKQRYLGLAGFYQQKRDYFNSAIANSRFKLIPSAGTYFQLLDYSGITQEKDTDYALRLVKESGIAAIPVSVFYKNSLDHKVLRFCFAKKPETLDKAAAILNNI